MNKYLVVTEVNNELKNDIVKAESPFEAMTKVSFLGEYDVKTQDLATVGVYELDKNLLEDMVSK